MNLAANVLARFVRFGRHAGLVGVTVCDNRELHASISFCARPVPRLVSARPGRKKKKKKKKRRTKKKKKPAYPYCSGGVTNDGE